MTRRHLPLALLMLTAAASDAQRPERGRELGIPFEGATGPLNAITDVGGVEVGHRTPVAGSGKLVVGKGPVRTTASRRSSRAAGTPTIPCSPAGSR